MVVFAYEKIHESPERTVDIKSFHETRKKGGGSSQEWILGRLMFMFLFCKFFFLVKTWSRNEVLLRRTVQQR